jgi:hypothetical protein
MHLSKKRQVLNYNVQNYKQKNNQKLLQGVQGDGFLEKSPPGRRRQGIFTAARHDAAPSPGGE